MHLPGEQLDRQYSLLADRPDDRTTARSPMFTVER
jgi:hypothetical protein